MNNDSLVNIIKSYRYNSLGSLEGELSNQRAEAMDRYHGRPYGNEIQGRSQIVSKDLSETVDWLIANILKVFLMSGNLFEFTAVNAEDEEAAKQETDYINQVIMNDNDGYLVMYDLLKDCLILKNCYVKHFWNEEEKIEEDEYEGLNEVQLAQLIGDLEKEGELDIVGQNERIEYLEQQAPDGAIVDVPFPVFDIKYKLKRKIAKLVLEAVPPEEIRVHKNTKGCLQESAFVEHFTTKTRSELIEMGMDKDFVSGLKRSDSQITNESQARSQNVEERQQVESLDDSMDHIEYSEAYVRIDFDEDGIAELRRVISVSDKVPPGDEWNEVVDAIPITGGVVKRMPHRHVGESIHDELDDLSEMKTVLQRQLFDNIYATNNQQFAVNERVNLEDMQISLPSGIKRVEGVEPVAGSIMPIVTAPILGQIMPAIQYVDEIRDGRTGLNKLNTQVDPDVLKETTDAQLSAARDSASAKVENYIRMWGETCVKEMGLQVHRILRQHQDIPRTVKLHGEYVDVNPQEWRERTDLTIRVGLGTGTEDEKRANKMFLVGLQEKAKDFGLINANHVFNMFVDLAETTGDVVASRYISDPSSEEFKQAQANKPPESNPLAEAEQVKAQAAIQIKQMDAQLKGQLEMANLQQKQQFEQSQNQLKLFQEDADRRSKEAIEVMKQEVALIVAGLKQDLGQPGIAAGVQE